VKGTHCWRNGGRDLDILKYGTLRTPAVQLRTTGAVSDAPCSSALFDGAGREGRPLFDLLAAAVRAQNLAFFVVHERQNLVEEFLAFLAEEFVVGHTGLHNFRRVTEQF